MSFVLNPVNEQQLSLFDSYENLTERERKFLINFFPSIFSQRLMKSLMLSFTVEKIPGQILR